MKELIDRLDTPSDHKAEAVIRELKPYGRKAVGPLLKAAQDSSRPRVRKWSLQALGDLGDRRAIPLLVAALKDERMTVKLHALRGLARLKAKSAAKPVAKLLKDESGGIRMNALQTLQALGDRTLDSVVKKALSDEQWYIRQRAAEICGEWRIARASAALRKLAIDDERKAVREAAKRALARYASRAT